MSYVRKNLMPGEQVVATARLHWIVFIPGLEWLLAAIACWIAACAVSGIPVYLLGVAAIGFAILGVWKELQGAIEWLTSEFALTDKRVIFKVGFVRRRTVEMLLRKVESIEVIQGVIGRLIGYGTIEITGTGGSPTPYDRIASPMRFRQAVQTQLEEAS